MSPPAPLVPGIVESNVGPKIGKLDFFIFAADAVDAPELLDNADRVPMDVVVYNTGNDLSRKGSLKILIYKKVWSRN